MSYGPLYKMSYYNEFGVLVEVYIKKLDYAGATTEVKGGEDPLRVVMSGESSEKFQTIRGTSAEIDLVSETDFQFISLHTSDFKQYKVEIYKATVLDWTGWLLPDYYQEPYEQTPYTVTIHAADGLGILKNYDLILSNGSHLTGKQWFMDVLNQIFLKIGTGLSLWENINIYEDNIASTAADSVLDQIYLNTEIFYDTEGNPINCYDALVGLLKHYNAYITQSKGTWHIIRVPTNKESYTRRLWTWNIVVGFVYDSNEAHDPQVSTTGNIALASLVRFVGNTLTVSPPWKEFTITQDYGTKESILENGEFNYDSFTWDGARWWTSHWIDINTPSFAPAPKGKNFEAYVIGGIIASRPHRSNRYENLTPLNYWPNNEYCLKITGTDAAIATAKGISNSDTELVLSITDSLLFHIEYITSSTTCDINLEISIVGVTTQYMDNDGAWSAVQGYINTTDNPKGGSVTLEIQSDHIPIAGDLTVKLFETVDGAATESDFIKWINIKVGYLPSGRMPAKELQLTTPVNSNNIYIPGEIDLMLGDMPDHDNNAILYENGLFYDSGGVKTPTSAWTDGNTSISKSLIQSMADAIAIENNKPYQVISGTIYSNLIDFTSIIREINNNNYLFMINSATLHDKMGAWDVELIQFAETFDILAEDGSTLISEASAQLITE